MFYETPIVKYWLSLVARLVYLALFAYTVSLQLHNRRSPLPLASASVARLLERGA